MKARSAAALLILGLAQMVGDAVGSPELEGLAAASGMAPAPRVFTSFAGFEPYSTEFLLEWERAGDGSVASLPLTPQRYSRLRGPYNRRNVYGAALAGGPVLVGNPHLEPLWEDVARYALCGEAPLVRELGADPGDVRGAPWLRYRPRSGSALDPERYVLRAPCS